ncbi:serine protease [Streptomyces sp. NPDC050619]|uniref:S1 family peptidase n=1 Tax=Streptomyces sp. NPDC050619 TaxID=3157214 RepID=UPI00344629E5
MYKHKRTVSSKKKARIGFAVAGVAAAAVVAATSAQAIVGGQPTGIEKNSFLVMVQYDGNKFCTGTAISPTKIATSVACAAHTEQLDTTVVIAGRDNALDEKQGVKLKPDAWWIPNWYSDHSWQNRKNQTTNVPTNDMAVIHLAKPLPGTYKPIKMVPSDFKYKAGTKARIIGWGTTSEDQEETTGELREANVDVIPNSACQRAYQGDYKSANMVCAGKLEGGVDACSHDGGGPLLISDGKDERLAGIVSWGEGCAEAGNPGVYTKVSRFAADFAALPD